MMNVKDEVINILECSIIKNNILYLPSNLDRKTYLKVSKVLKELGGTWNRKLNGHLFEIDPTDCINEIIETKQSPDFKKDNQFFPTPLELATEMIKIANIKNDDFLLEPSAGQGAIADLFPKNNKHLLIELNNKNYNILLNKGYNVLNKNFLEVTNIFADKIIMNPPFSRKQDEKHILHAYNLLNKKGILISIACEGTFCRREKSSEEFRKFLKDVKANVIKLDENTFKKSGTSVNTRMIIINK